MQNPLEVAFKDVAPNPRIESLIQEKFDKIPKISSGIIKCRVALEKLSKHHTKGNACSVLLDLKLARFPDIVVREESQDGERPLTSAVREVFKKTHELVKKQIGRRKKKVVRPEMKEEELVSSY